MSYSKSWASALLLAGMGVLASVGITANAEAAPTEPKFANLVLVTPTTRAVQQVSQGSSMEPALPTRIPPLATTEYFTAVSTVNYLSTVEREIVAETNRLRAEPSRYADELENLRSYFDGNLLRLPGLPPIETVEGVAAVDEAIAALRDTAPLPVLTPSPGMSHAARDHVRDLGSLGADGHYGSDGSTPFDRLNRYGSWEAAPGSQAGENLSYSPINVARWHVMQWIVDDGVSNRGHRQAILRQNYRYTGISCGEHTVYGTMCSMTYASDFIEGSER
ncbi:MULTISPECIES: CAP domain-containing protein [unclassified Leptolyngbya]|uniref:CAP domain-containing protein n=1 Tax=unclassified Leptolyngbya TaxID=2650499 RepID=UPI001684CCF0|nr:MULTISPECIES: CAP domain-containing protein [unclassified Leptolyngbya]MBD1910136.1 CAP domain-containing protein [Leptolyngbya sp. FACHB-8]MBD2153568.1 CAP domain-containing protein [Leptolyngbya sp. FACHB-16]